MNNLRGLLTRLSLFFRHIFAPKRFEAFVDFSKVIDHLANHCLPLGKELTDSDWKLLREEARRSPDHVPLKRLSDVVANLKKSKFRRVREFASYCDTEGFVDCALESADFMGDEYSVSSLDSLREACASGFVVMCDLGRSVFYSCVWIAAGWLLILGLPIALAVVAPTTDLNLLSSSMEHALSTAITRWNLFCDINVVFMSFLYGIIAGVFRFAWSNKAQFFCTR